MAPPADGSAVEWRRGQLSAWLLKKKSGTAMMRVRQYNKRFFTIDFDSRVFYYAHQENSKKVSSVMSFSELLDVTLPGAKTNGAGEQGAVGPTSSGSMLRRGFSFGSNAGGKENSKAQHAVILRMRPSRDMELLCSSVNEAEMWFEAFQAAIAMGGGPAQCDSGGEPATSPFPSEPAEDPQDTPLLAAAGDVATSTQDRNADAPPCPEGAPANQGYPSPAAPPAPAAATAPDAAAGISSVGKTAHPAPAAVARAPAAALAPPMPVQDEAEGTRTAAGEDAPATPPPKPAKGSFLDFSIEEDPGSAGAASSTGAHGGAEVEVSVMVEAPEAGLDFQANDFGFEDNEDSASSNSGSEGGGAGDVVEDGHAPLIHGGRGGGYSSAEVPTAVASSPASPESLGNNDKRKGVESAARDRHEGLSMQERLANLEFSDCEDDDDDDPLGLKTKADDD